MAHNLSCDPEAEIWPISSTDVAQKLGCDTEVDLWTGCDSVMAKLWPIYGPIATEVWPNCDRVVANL